ncbi:hypothetical protein [Paenibacillus sp. FSL H3-0333]|uniref:hypothetical protein n=1 Tax=Paenibacillus sp. FSL H3-0333 TaxID=2921373 RepID=UPI0030F4EC16
MEGLLKRVATVFRETMESIHWSEFPESCQLNHSFPGGACGDTSMLLGKHFLEKYKIDCTYICGSCLIEGREQWTHAWLEYDGYKIDITADQFDEVDDKVIVKKSHLLYDYYEPDKGKKISEAFPEELESSYRRIKQEIDEMYSR